MPVRSTAKHFTALIIAILIYAITGAPTPDALGVPEMVIGALLVYAAFPALLNVFTHASHTHIIIVIGIIIAALIGVLHGHDPRIIARDIIAFLFIALPFLIAPIITTPKQRDIFIVSLVILGVIFAVRGIFASLGIHGDRLTYFANAPTVLFACLALIGYGLYRFSLKSIAFIALALIPFVAIHLTLQRASIACIACGVLVFWAHLAKSHPVRAVLIAVLFLLIGYFFRADIAFMLDAYIAKTKIHGANMRPAEWQAVIDTISVSPLHILFGKGWGATFASPAVADITVSYTHGFLSAMLLKTGFIGLMITVIFCTGILRTLYNARHTTPLYILCPLLFAFVIPVFLYASYKSFDFGLILTAIMLCENTVCKNAPFIETHPTKR